MKKKLLKNNPRLRIFTASPPSSRRVTGVAAVTTQAGMTTTTPTGLSPPPFSKSSATGRVRGRPRAWRGATSSRAPTATPTSASPPPVFEGDVYSAQALHRIPATLRGATELFRSSPFVREALGGEVVDHYSHFFTVEQEAYDAAVTDWERKRDFERI
jgi:hypothetical protein